MLMSDKNIIRLPSDRAIILDNTTCPYCGLPINFNDRDSWDKDHVIGRRFVPKGELNNQWNLQVNAHKNCNNFKSKLEDDISAISMQPDGLGYHHSDNDNLRNDSKRKEKSISKYTGKPVKDSYTTINTKATVFDRIDLNASFTSPPQISDDRIFH